MKTIINHDKFQNSNGSTESRSMEAGGLLKQNIWFSINTLGFFKYISPPLLEYLEGMDNQFFESVLFEKSGKNQLPSSVEYLTEMINPDRNSVFVEEVLKNEHLKINGTYWDIVAEGSILKFTLCEAPPTVEPEMRRVS